MQVSAMFLFCLKDIYFIAKGNIWVNELYKRIRGPFRNWYTLRMDLFALEVWYYYNVFVAKTTARLLTKIHIKIEFVKIILQRTFYV